MYKDINTLLTEKKTEEERRTELFSLLPDLKEGNNNVAHKYGWYSTYYHDIGIVYEKNPYYISVLTNHGKGDYKKIVNNIHKKINELHHLFYEERQNNCHLNIYGS